MQNSTATKTGWVATVTADSDNKTKSLSTVNQAGLDDIKMKSLALIEELQNIGNAISEAMNAGVWRAWRLGRYFINAKKIAGHGNWITWIENNIPMSKRNVQNYMQLHLSNPDASSVEDIPEDAIRKFQGSYVSPKPAAQLEGDRVIPKSHHHLTLLNDWRRWQRKIEIGHTKMEVEEVKSDLRPLYDWLCSIYNSPPIKESPTDPE